MAEDATRLCGNRPIDEVVPGSIGLSLASGVLLWSIAWIVFGLSARAWPTAEAEILECRFESSKRQRQGLRYTLRLRYRYAVGGKTYEGSRLYFGAAIQTYAGAAMGKVRMRTPGDRVAVRYFPLAPGVCTLDPGVGWQVWVAFVLSLLVTFNLVMGALAP